MNLGVWFDFLERARAFSAVVFALTLLLPAVVGTGHLALLLGGLFVALAPLVELYYHASRQPEVLFEREFRTGVAIPLFEREFRTGVAIPLFERFKTSRWNNSTRERIENYGQARQLANSCFARIVIQSVIGGFWVFLYTEA